MNRDSKENIVEEHNTTEVATVSIYQKLESNLLASNKELSIIDRCKRY